MLGIPVIENDIRCDGILTSFGDQFIIQVKRSSPDRQNFTVCHELGHAEIFRRALVLHKASREVREEEVLANEFAKELLMPKDIFCAIALSCQPSLQSLFFLSHTFGTSLEASARRLIELNIWNFAFVLWNINTAFDGGILLEIERAVKPQNFKPALKTKQTLKVNKEGGLGKHLLETLNIPSIVRYSDESRVRESIRRSSVQRQGLTLLFPQSATL
ncbi:ImmA/IrrE family metallo-endopeptidase [Candidatus Pacearchaeota archaeon]|nr:ImmA/IrrE family metallo-endopeptidase [Candidatus Pacearchaeota archaeon]